MRTPEVDASHAATRSRYGLPAPGSELEVELLAPMAPDGRRGTVTGALVDVVLDPANTDTPAAVLIAHPGRARSVVPWHAIARVIVRPPADHPAL